MQTLLSAGHGERRRALGHWGLAVYCPLIVHGDQSRVSEDSGPQRHRPELFNRRAGTSLARAGERARGTNKQRTRRRCFPRQGPRRLQGFLRAVERRGPRHPRLAASEDRARETTVISALNPRKYRYCPAYVQSSSRPPPVKVTFTTDGLRLSGLLPIHGQYTSWLRFRDAYRQTHFSVLSMTSCLQLGKDWL
jgi:hypothetical protein